MWPPVVKERPTRKQEKQINKDVQGTHKAEPLGGEGFDLENISIALKKLAILKCAQKVRFDIEAFMAPWTGFHGSEIK